MESYNYRNDDGLGPGSYAVSGNVHSSLFAVGSGDDGSKAGDPAVARGEPVGPLGERAGTVRRGGGGDNDGSGTAGSGGAPLHRPTGSSPARRGRKQQQIIEVMGRDGEMIKVAIGRGGRIEPICRGDDLRCYAPPSSPSPSSPSSGTADTRGGGRADYSVPPPLDVGPSPPQSRGNREEEEEQQRQRRQQPSTPRDRGGADAYDRRTDDLENEDWGEAEAEEVNSAGLGRRRRPQSRITEGSTNGGGANCNWGDDEFTRALADPAETGGGTSLPSSGAHRQVQQDIRSRRTVGDERHHPQTTAALSDVERAIQLSVLEESERVAQREREEAELVRQQEERLTQEAMEASRMEEERKRRTEEEELAKAMNLSLESLEVGDIGGVGGLGGSSDVAADGDEEMERAIQESLAMAANAPLPREEEDDDEDEEEMIRRAMRISVREEQQRSLNRLLDGYDD